MAKLYVATYYAEPAGEEVPYVDYFLARNQDEAERTANNNAYLLYPATQFRGHRFHLREVDAMTLSAAYGNLLTALGRVAT